MSNPQRPYKIVVGLDGSDRQDAVMEKAFDVANRHLPCEIHVVRVVDVGSNVLGRVHDGKLDAAHAELVELVAGLAETFAPPGDMTWTIQAHARVGVAAAEILSLAADVETDLIVVGRHGSGGRRPSVGAVPAALVAGALCPVLIERPLEYDLHQDRAEECDACVALRHESRGERWFCADHAGSRPFKSTTLMGASSFLLGGVY